MVTVSQLKAYGAVLQSAINTIGHNKTIVDDSQLVNDLDAITPEHKHLLYLIIPSAKNDGQDDALRKNNNVQFLVLQKTDDTITHDAFLEIMEQTQQTALAIERHMLLSKTDPSNDGCSFMVWLQESTISIDPIWDYAECNGWTIEFSMKTSL